MSEATTILPFFILTKLSLAVLLLPFLSFLVTIALPKKENKNAFIAVSMLFTSFIISIFLLFNIWGKPPAHAQWIWFEIGNIRFTAGIWLNNLTVLLLSIVTFVSFLVHLFSVEYMKNDDGFMRYFSFLGLFTFSMLGVVLADNLLILFVFWELVGLSSYLLIGFWFHKESASEASKKAFIVNRIGDTGFLIGLMILWANYGTLDLATLAHSADLSDPMLTMATLCLFCGVVGKSAQFPLLVWLPDAMEGPTPVSALIHAATMVAAGVFLLARINPIVPVDALHIIALVGAITAFMGGIAAIRQFDIKKILAYSTISQLGYMVVGVGAGAYDAAIFHLTTHAFFKACLFLSAGAIIHTLHQFAHNNNVDFDAQDIRFMGGLRKKMPFTFWVFLLSSFALMGIPFFSGFLSKDAILIAAAAMPRGWQIIVPILAFGSVLLTAYYVIRMLLIVFEGENRLSKVVAVKNVVFSKIPLFMKIPLALLAAGSVFIFFSFHPFDGSHSWLMVGMANKVAPHHNSMIPILSVLLVMVGAMWAYTRFKPQSDYIKNIHEEVNHSNVWQSLSFNNWHLDSIYNLVFVKQIIAIGRKIRMFEEKILDGIINYFAVFNVILAKVIRLLDKYIVDGFVHFAAAASKVVGWLSKNIQGGQVQTHIAWAGVGLLILLLWLVV